MFKKFLFSFYYLLAWVVFFELARLYFLSHTWQYARGTSNKLVFLSLWHGLKMDLSMACYISLMLCLFFMAGLFVPFFRRKKVYIIYTGIVLFIQLLLILADAEIYKAWGNRIDFTALKYISNPKEMWASISYLPLFWILAGFLVVYLVLLWCFNLLLRWKIHLLQNAASRWVQLPVILLFFGLFIIPIRGGLQLSPLNQSSVYFCNDQYANNAAVNASWNFMYSVTLMNQLKGNPYVYMKEEEARRITDSLYKTDGKTEQVLNVTDSLRPNVILIVWESLTEKALNLQINGKWVTPGIKELIKEGIYFSNCYASSDRTDKGISAVLSGYPGLPKGSIIAFPDKTTGLPGLGKIFLDHGFSTSFYYGGESEFANMKSYLITQQFQHYTTKSDFKKSDMNSKWGAHDGVVMNRVLTEVPKMQQPFFSTWLTLSSHEPFETPVPTVFKGKDNETKFLNAHHYTDSVVYTFINELKKMPLWKNTVVIISADHGHPIPVTGKRADDYRMPLLWLGGALKKQGIIEAKAVNQLDIPGSLVQQFHFPENRFLFSKNLFDSSSKHWSFFIYNDGIGLVTDSSRILFDNTGKRIVFKEGKPGKEQENIARALMQSVYTDFLKR